MKKNTTKETFVATSPSKTGKIKRLLFCCMLVIIPLILMEIFSFTYIKLSSKKGAYRERIRPVFNPYHPYLGYVHAPNSTFEVQEGLSEKSILQTDENGHSITPAFSHQRPDMKIVVTGGSTMFGIGSSDNMTTVPSMLERLINEQLGIRAEVINLAMKGANAFQEMLLVDRFFAENQADLVLSITGRNDAAHTYVEPNVESAFLRKHVWDNAVALVHKAEKGDLMLVNLVHKMRSWSYTFDLLYRQITKRSGKAPLASSSGLNLRKEVATTIENRTKIIATHFAVADVISRMNGARFVMFLQPTLYTKDFWTEQEIHRMKWKNWSDEVIQKRRDSEHEFYEAFRKTKKPFQFIDLADVFSNSNETLYIDSNHYNDNAAEKLAMIIFDQIRPILQRIKKG